MLILCCVEFERIIHCIRVVCTHIRQSVDFGHFIFSFIIFLSILLQTAHVKHVHVTIQMMAILKHCVCLVYQLVSVERCLLNKKKVVNDVGS